MIEHKVIRLKQKSKLPYGIEFPAGQELEIVRDVVFVQGAILPPETQAGIFKWIKDNPDAYIDFTKNYPKKPRW